MRAFKVTSPAHADQIVFADRAHHAAEMIVTWQMLNGIDAAEFMVDPDWIKELPREGRREVNEALRWGRPGIAVKRPDGRWDVREPRDEREDDDTI